LDIHGIFQVEEVDWPVPVFGALSGEGGFSGLSRAKDSYNPELLQEIPELS